MTPQQLIDFIEEEFYVKPDHPFDKDFESSVFRRKDNNKWFALLMNISKDKLGLESEEKTWILNVKVDTMMRHALLQKKGIKTAFHMNKIHWVTIILDEAEDEDTKFLLGTSFSLVGSKKKNASVS